MRTIQLLTLTLLAAGCFSAKSQVQNTSFENWAFTDTTWDGQPIYIADQWIGGQRTDDSYSGNYAAKVLPYMSCGMMRNYMMYGANPGGFIVWDEEPEFNGSGLPIHVKPVSISGYFQFLSPAADDIARGIVVLKKFNAAAGVSEEVGRGEIVFSPTSGYVPFTIQVADLQPGVMPDSIAIAFSSGMGYSWENETTNVGTLYVDELRILAGNTTSGLQEITFAASFSPNPTHDVLHVTFDAGEKDDFTFVLTDMSGRRVISQPIIPGIGSSIQTLHLSAGTYVATLHGSRKVYGRETILKVD